MAIQRWDPQRDLVALQQRVARLFEEALSRSAGADAESASGSWRPPLDLYEESTRYVMRCDLPGIESAEVQLQVENGRLLVRGERPADTGVAREAFLRVERPYGPFSIQIALPPSVDPREIRATQRNGVLEIVLPKRREAGPSRIEVSNT